MSRKVVYYTRSGYSKAVAEKIARHLDCPLVQVTDNGNWKGILGFLRGGYYASTGKDVEITVHGPIGPADELVVVSPLWAGRVLPAMRAFFRTTDRGACHYVVTSNGVALRERDGFRSVTDIVRSRRDEDAVLGRLYATL